MANDTIRAALEAVLGDMGAPTGTITLERPRDPTHGDVATNVALTLAKPLSRAPRQIAEEIAEKLDLSAAGVDSVEVADKTLELSLQREVRELRAGEYLYVRVVQRDGGAAWSSPFFIEEE